MQRGDTLGAIAARYNTTAAAIARANSLSSPDRIYAGMKLRIPGSAGSTSSQAGSAPKSSRHRRRALWPASRSSIVGSTRGAPCSIAGPAQPAVLARQRCRAPTGSSPKCRVPMARPGTSGCPIGWASTGPGSTENGIHGLPYDRGTGVKVWTSRIGTPITYGCILLADATRENALRYGLYRHAGDHHSVSHARSLRNKDAAGLLCRPAASLRFK